jgi:hypothetical protein
MSDFEWWFLLAYTTYTVISILALMWIADRAEPTQKQSAQAQGRHLGGKK